MPVTAPKPRKRLTRKESRAQTRATLIAVPGTGYTGTIRPNPTGAPISMSRGSQHLNMLRHLRLRRITPALLHIKITSAEQVAIVDLLSFEEGHEGLAGIPGAVRMTRLAFAAEFEWSCRRTWEWSCTVLPLGS